MRVVHSQRIVRLKNHNRFQDSMFDQAPYHTTQRSKPTFASASIDVKWILKPITQFLQPADQSWMRPIFLIINC